MNLTRNFTLSELIESDTAIRRDINNNPNAEQIEKLKEKVNMIANNKFLTPKENIFTSERMIELTISLYHDLLRTDR